MQARRNRKEQARTQTRSASSRSFKSGTQLGKQVLNSSANSSASSPANREAALAYLAQHDPLVEVHMMRVEVVGDVRGLARPGLEGLELVLGLAHVGVPAAGERVRRQSAGWFSAYLPPWRRLCVDKCGQKKSWLKTWLRVGCGCAHVGAAAELLDAVARVDVDRVEALVHLHLHQHP